jgi:hypothetical protein
MSSELGGDTASSIKNMYDGFIRNKDPAKASKVWQEIVMEYTRCDLTQTKDMLPALSGIALQLQSSNRGTYLAGLWEQDLLSQLCWYSETFPGRRPSPPTAPTFSWASRTGPVNFKAGGEEESWPLSFGEVEDAESRVDTKKVWTKETHVQMVEAQCNTRPPNLYGEVEGGFIKLRGYLLEATLIEDSSLAYDDS